MLTFKQFLDEKKEALNVNMNKRELEKHITSKGWYLHRTSGPHDIWKHPKSTNSVKIPRHKNLTIGVIRDVLNTSNAT